MKNKGFGFYTTIVSAILTIAALALYGKSFTTVQIVYVWLAAALAVEVIGIIAAVIGKGGEWTNWVPVIGAAATMWGLLQGVDVMLDPCGYVVAGLYVFSDIQGWVIFMVVAVVAVIVNLIGGFAKIVK